MTNISSYINYLPSFLWSQNNDPSQALGRILSIFEKILTGNIQDGAPIIHGDHQHDDFEKSIDELYQLFNPWRTRTDILPWLASWVALTLEEDWSEYQKRKLISEIVSFYQQRGLKKGLHTYLDIYTMTKAKPRIAIDNGDAIFRATFLENGTAELHAIAHSNSVSVPAGIITGLITVLLHPSGIAADSQNYYIVADQGDRTLTVPSNPSLWKISSTGEIGYTSGNPPMPNPIYSGPPLDNPRAMVVDSMDRYSVLNIETSPSGTAIYRFAPPDYAIIETVIHSCDTTPTFPAVDPVDMILDASENFIVLDRGDDSKSPVVPPKIIKVSESPVVVTSYDLTNASDLTANVVEPTAIVMDLMDSSGCFIIADAKNQYSTDPANLIRFNPIDQSQIRLLDVQNPLIFPSGIAFESPKSLLVCDTGVRRGMVAEPNNRVMAEPATIYRVDLSQSSPTVTRLTPERKLVNPTKMMFDRKGKLIITDMGESRFFFKERNWRAGTNEFGVVLLFSEQRHIPDRDRFKIRQDIMNVIEEQKPGDTSWWMNY